VEGIEDAELAIIRLSAPYQPRKDSWTAWFHAGDLDFKGEDKERLVRLLESSPPSSTSIWTARR